MPRNFGLPPREDDDLGFFVGVGHALAIEGIAVLVGFLGFAVYINFHALMAQVGQ